MSVYYVEAVYRPNIHETGVPGLMETVEETAQLLANP